MKVKNINFIERHIEKFLLGVCAIVAVLIVLFYVMGQPYAVKLGVDDNVAPGDVPGKIYDRARALEAGVNKKETPLPTIPVPNYAIKFLEEIARSPNHGVRSYEVPIGSHGLDPIDIPVETPDPIEPTKVPPPPPTDLMVRADFGLLGEQPNPEVQAALANLIGNQQPRDFRHVSISAIFDFDEWRKQLRSVMPADKKMDEAWWRNQMMVTHLILERQQISPTPGPIEKISPLPGYVGVAEIGKNENDAAVLGIMQQIRQFQNEIQRQPFPVLAGERPWFPPDAKAELAPEAMKKWNELADEIAKIQKKIDQMKGAAAPAAPVNANKPGGAAPARDGGRPGAAPAAPAAPAAAAAPAAPSAELAALQSQLQQKIAERNQLIAGKPVAAETHQPGDVAVDGGVVQFGRIQIWAHDVTVRPGATYQYRIRVACVSPFFHKPAVKMMKDPSGYDILSWVSEPSQWSKPVTVDPETRTYLANVTTNVTDPTIWKATFEVWRIFDGKWRAKTFEVQPGDLIGAHAEMKAGNNTATLDFRTPYVLVSVQGAGNAGRTVMLDTNASENLIERTVDGDRQERMKLGGGDVKAADAR